MTNKRKSYATTRFNIKLLNLMQAEAEVLIAERDCEYSLYKAELDEKINRWMEEPCYGY